MLQAKGSTSALRLQSARICTVQLACNVYIPLLVTISAGDSLHDHMGIALVCQTLNPACLEIASALLPVHQSLGMMATTLWTLAVLYTVASSQADRRMKRT